MVWRWMEQDEENTMDLIPQAPAILSWMVPVPKGRLGLRGLEDARKEAEDIKKRKAAGLKDAFGDTEPLPFEEQWRILENVLGNPFIPKKKGSATCLKKVVDVRPGIADRQRRRHENTKTKTKMWDNIARLLIQPGVMHDQPR